MMLRRGSKLALSQWSTSTTSAASMASMAGWSLPSSRSLWDILKREHIEKLDAPHIADIWSEVSGGSSFCAVSNRPYMQLFVSWVDLVTLIYQQCVLIQFHRDVTKHRVASVLSGAQYMKFQTVAAEK